MTFYRLRVSITLSTQTFCLAAVMMLHLPQAALYLLVGELLNFCSICCFNNGAIPHSMSVNKYWCFVFKTLANRLVPYFKLHGDTLKLPSWSFC